MFTRQEIEEHFAKRCANTQSRGQNLEELDKIIKEKQYCLDTTTYFGMCFSDGQISIRGHYLVDFAPPYQIMAEIYMTFSLKHYKKVFKRVKRLVNYVIDMELDSVSVDISNHKTVLLS